MLPYGFNAERRTLNLIGMHLLVLLKFITFGGMRRLGIAW